MDNIAIILMVMAIIVMIIKIITIIPILFSSACKRVKKKKMTVSDKKETKSMRELVVDEITNRIYELLSDNGFYYIFLPKSELNDHNKEWQKYVIDTTEGVTFSTTTSPYSEFCSVVLNCKFYTTEGHVFEKKSFSLSWVRAYSIRGFIEKLGIKKMSEDEFKEMYVDWLTNK